MGGPKCLISGISFARPGGEEAGEGTIFDPKSSRLLVPNILCPPSSRHLHIGGLAHLAAHRRMRFLPLVRGGAGADLKPARLPINPLEQAIVSD